jgi:putative colanic acid biosynthesis acetyltransferase WcaF
MVLRIFGAHIGFRVQIHPTARIAIPWNLCIGNNSSIGDNATIYNLGRVTIGQDASVSQNAHICAGSHNFNKPDLPLTKPPIAIEEGAWICADAFVGPGVTIGAFSIVGARGVVVHDVAPNQIVAGNPAKFIKMRNLSDHK